MSYLYKTPEGLLPCPHCGGEARIIAKPYELKFCVGCDDDTCLGFSGLGWLYDSEQEAAEAWNRRAERTCRMVDCSTHDTCVVNCELSNGDVMSMEFGYRQCSECGAYVFDCPTVRYCPSCGARVIVENSNFVLTGSDVFGRYCRIEQLRFGVPNEMFLYKVVASLRSNCWCEVPYKTASKEVRHDSIEDCILAICCGIDETEVLQFRVADVEFVPKPTCDRDALLALADEMTVEKGDIWGWSSRIREALGVES